MRFVATALLALTLACASVAQAARSGSPAAVFHGGQFTTQTWSAAPTFVDHGTCTQLTPAAAPAQKGLTAFEHGWLGPVVVANGTQTQQVHLAAEVTGTLVDAAGNTYQAFGHFNDDTVHNLFVNELRFDGTGRFLASGPAGVVSGTATFRIVSGPAEFQLALTHVQLCTVH